MRQLTVIFLSLIFSFQAFAFHDPVTIGRIKQLKERLESEAPQNRLAHFESFKRFMFKRLNSPDLMPEDSLSIPDGDPRLDEYASLTEFSGYVNLISPKEVTNASCHSVHQDLANTVKSQGEETPEAVEAVKIIGSLCK
jgi:hypothetical protein